MNTCKDDTQTGQFRSFDVLDIINGKTTAPVSISDRDFIELLTAKAIEISKKRKEQERAKQKAQTPEQ